MLMRALADAVLILHGAFIVFVVLGGFLALKWRWFAWLHLPAAVWGFLIEAKRYACPLTHLENHLRRRAGQEGYEGGFVENYLIPVIYPAGMTRQLQIVLAVLVVAVNVAVYGWVVWRLRSRRPPPGGSGCG